MAKGSTFDNDLLKLIFNGTAIANIADNAGTSPLTSVYISLHTSDPTASGNQSSNEVSYTGYQRVAVSRSTSGWTVSGNAVNPASSIQFPISTGGTGGTVTNFAVGTLQSGAGKILYTGTVSPTITVATNVTPILTTASSVTES